MELVSVVIPTCDRGELLKRAVKSVLDQSIQPAKIVIVDNGREENRTVFNDRRIVIIRTRPRLGPGKPRNIGAKECKTPYIAFLDDDDYWEPCYLEYSLKKFEKSHADVVIGRLRKCTLDNIVKEYKTFPDNYIEQRAVFYKNPGFGGQNIVIKRHVFFEVGMFDEKMPASVDRDLAAKILLAGKKIAYESLSVAVLCEHCGARARANIVRGNYMFLRKYWLQMSYYEKYKAANTLIFRCIKLAFAK